MKEKAYSINENTFYLHLQECDSGWDYTLFDVDFAEIDGGQLDAPELNIKGALKVIIADFIDEYVSEDDTFEEIDVETLLNNTCDIF